MTLEATKEPASQQLMPHIIFRLPKWPANVWGIVAERSLPAEAEIIQVPHRKFVDKQGSLF